ncbi:MAG: hypothetical protein ABW167_07625 [Baekduia sp.]
MGRHQIELSALATLSRRNAPEDDADNKAWNAFVGAVNDLANASHLDIAVLADGGLPEDQWS